MFYALIRGKSQFAVSNAEPPFGEPTQHFNIGLSFGLILQSFDLLTPFS